MIKKLSSSFLLFFCFFSAFSQADSIKTTDTAKSAPPVVITGSIDVYYRYNFANATNAATGKPVTNNFTSFTNSQNSFELGMASLQAAHSFGKANAFIDVGLWKKSAGI